MRMPKKSDALVKEALKAAKALEKIPLPSDKDIAALAKEGLSHAQQLHRLLKPEWFVKDTDVSSKKKAKK
jgi:hypothetical protein